MRGFLLKAGDLNGLLFTGEIFRKLSSNSQYLEIPCFRRNRRRKPHKPAHGFSAAIFLTAMESPSNSGEKRTKETVKITHPSPELSRIESGGPAHIYHLSIQTPSGSFPPNKLPRPGGRASNL